MVYCHVFHELKHRGHPFMYVVLFRKRDTFHVGVHGKVVEVIYIPIPLHYAIKELTNTCTLGIFSAILYKGNNFLWYPDEWEKRTKDTLHNSNAVYKGRLSVARHIKFAGKNKSDNYISHSNEYEI